MRNPFNFTFKSYTLIYNELRVRYPDKPVWFIELLAGQFDKLHWYLDARAENTLLSSAYTPERIHALAAMLDYYARGRSAGGGLCEVEIGMGVAPITIPKSELTIDIVTVTGQRVKCEALEDLTISSGTTGEITFYQGQTIGPVSLGVSDETAYQTFILPEANILDDDTITLTVNSVEWERHETLVNSLSTDTHYRVTKLPDGFLQVEFGDDEFGAIPGPYDIIVSYRRGGGVIGNIAQSGSTVEYTGGNSDVVTVTMLEDFTGGSVGETLERTRFMAPRMLKTQERAVTQDDYELLSLRFSASVIEARCFPGLYGEATIGVHIVPAGGGNPSTGLKVALQNDLIERSTLGQTDVRVRDPFYQTEDIEIDLKVRPGFSFSLVQHYASLACRLLVTETVKEILDIYQATGIEAAVTYINNRWSYTFASSDYATIRLILDRRQRDGYNSWGDGLRPNDIISAVDSIPQVDYVTVTTPVANVNVPYTDRLTEGTVTVNEIT